MKTAVIAGVSHKGGTGRSVTLANIAYQLHYRERASVCLVDLDLASPTMGSILEIPDFEFGQLDPSPRGELKNVHDILFHQDFSLGAALDVSSRSKSVARRHRVDKKFGFIPGYSAGGDWTLGTERLQNAIRNMLDKLRASPFDFIILDIRSGLSDVLDALSFNSRDLIDMVIVHTRWTPQHIIGLESILSAESVQAFGAEKVRIIRTAFIDPKAEPDDIKRFATGVDFDLKKKFENIELFGKSMSLRKPPYLGSIPMDPRLRLKESILTEPEGASAITFEIFEKLAGKIASEIRG